MSEETKELYDFGPFRLDASRRLVSRGQQVLPLTAKTFDTLLVLVRNHQRVLAKQELMETLWPDSFVEEVNLGQFTSAWCMTRWGSAIRNSHGTKKASRIERSGCCGLRWTRSLTRSATIRAFKNWSSAWEWRSEARELEFRRAMIIPRSARRGAGHDGSEAGKRVGGARGLGLQVCTP
jgi:hypothetical protein